MAVRETSVPWSYRKGKGLLYKIPAWIKLIFFLFLSAGVFAFHFYFLIIAAPVIIILAVSAGIRPWELLRGSSGLLLICVCILALKTLTFPGVSIAGFKEGCVLCAAMAISFSVGALFFSTTTMGEIRASLSRLESILCVEKLRISLAISLMLGFIPAFFEIWEETGLAWKSRGGKNRYVKYVILIPPVIDKLIEKAARMAEAMETRGF